MPCEEHIARLSGRAVNEQSVGKCLFKNELADFSLTASWLTGPLQAGL
jgi:hypothetical protein